MSRIAQHRLKVAIGLVFSETQQQVLVSLRPHQNTYGGLWEFPGGKFEQNETPFEALKRELLEETGITLLQAKALTIVEHDYQDLSVKMYVLQVTDYVGVPFGREGQEVRWVSLDELTTLAFLEGNKTIIEQMEPLFHRLN
jgi:8-oxo-dGTP diphosphatase